MVISLVDTTYRVVVVEPISADEAIRRGSTSSLPSLASCRSPDASSVMAAIMAIPRVMATLAPFPMKGRTSAAPAVLYVMSEVAVIESSVALLSSVDAFMAVAVIRSLAPTKEANGPPIAVESFEVGAVAEGPFLLDSNTAHAPLRLISCIVGFTVAVVSDDGTRSYP